MEMVIDDWGGPLWEHKCLIYQWIWHGLAIAVHCELGFG